jgi:hypothetical protein
VFLISQATDVPPPDGQQRMGEVVSQGQQPADPKESIRIPIIVENKRAYSYDVFITPEGQFLPLNESRLAAQMFQASPYAEAPALNSGAGAGAASSQNMDPSVPASAQGGGNPTSGEMGKMSSVLEMLTIDKEAIDNFLNSVATDARLVDAVKLNEDFSSSLSKLSHVANAPVASEEEGLSFDNFDSAVISKVAGGYQVLGAVASPYQTGEFFIANQQSESIPLELRQGITKHGSVLLTTTHDELLGVEPSFGLEEVEETGVYSVLSKEGNAQKAAIITDVISLEGRELDLSLIVAPEGAAVQEKVAGIRCGDIDLSTIGGSTPAGEGAFFFKKLGAISEPIEVKHTITKDGETAYLYERPLQGSGTIKLADVVRPVLVEGNDFLIPGDSVFIPFELTGRYEADAYAVDKIASRRDEINKVRIVSDGSEFTFSGAPVENIKKASGLNADQALLLVGLLGDSPDGALETISLAASGEDVSFVSTVIFKEAAVNTEPDEELVRLASVIRLDLTKEAAALVGPDTVDSVLSLNFITPENVAGYLDAMPVFEEASSKLAELLVGVRLGLSDVPEGAVSSALSGVERAVQGLKKLQIRNNAAQN